MAKRLRSLASVLWEDGDAEPLLEVWNNRALSSSGCNDRCVCRDLVLVQKDLQEEKAKCSALEQEIHTLRALIKDFEVKNQFLESSTGLKTSRCKADPWSWLNFVPEPVLQLPRFQNEILQDLETTDFSEQRVAFDFVQSPLASTVLRHGEELVRGFSRKHPAVYKVGITSNPSRRWSHTKYGYQWDKRDRWDGMLVIFAHADPQAVCFLEASLIRIFYGSPGCRNTRLGGEGVPPDLAGPFFCYLVYRILIPPRPK